MYGINIFICDYLDAGSKEAEEIFLVLSESNLLPTASDVDVCYCLQLACGNQQFHICNVMHFHDKLYVESRWYLSKINNMKASQLPTPLTEPAKTRRLYTVYTQVRHGGMVLKNSKSFALP